MGWEAGKGGLPPRAQNFENTPLLHVLLHLSTHQKIGPLSFLQAPALSFS